MKKAFLASSFLALALLGVLCVGVSLGLAQPGLPVTNARPTPTPDGPVQFEPAWLFGVFVPWCYRFSVKRYR